MGGKEESKPVKKLEKVVEAANFHGSVGAAMLEDEGEEDNKEESKPVKKPVKAVEAPSCYGSNGAAMLEDEGDEGGRTNEETKPVKKFVLQSMHPVVMAAMVRQCSRTEAKKMKKKT